jgi:hypothetical protein
LASWFICVLSIGGFGGDHGARARGSQGTRRPSSFLWRRRGDFPFRATEYFTIAAAVFEKYYPFQTFGEMACNLLDDLPRGVVVHSSTNNAWEGDAMLRLARGMPDPLPLGTALLTDAAVSLLLWNVLVRLAVAVVRFWPGLIRAFA